MSVAGLLTQGRSESSAFYTVPARLDCSCHPLRSAGQCSPFCFGLPSTLSKFSAFNSDGHGPEPALGLRVNGLIIRLFDTVAVPSRPDWKRKTLVDPESPAGRARAQVRGGLGRPRLGGLPGVPRTRTPALSKGPTGTHSLAAGPKAPGTGRGGSGGSGRAPPAARDAPHPGSAARFPEPGRSGSGAGDATRPGPRWASPLLTAPEPAPRGAPRFPRPERGRCHHPP